MIKKSFLLGAIVSIITTNAIANQVITSQTYVDNQDALKVNIAQGVGTNNANVGKTLVVNSQGNLELGTPSAGNYVEDSITDGVTNKAPSENAVHDALADKQDTIETGLVDVNEQLSDLPSLVSYDTQNGLVGNEIGLVTQAKLDECSYVTDFLMGTCVSSLRSNNWDQSPLSTHLDDMVPTIGTVVKDFQNVWGALDYKQVIIPKSGSSDHDPTWSPDFTDGNGDSESDWLNPQVKGAGLVTKTSTNGVIGERKIFEASDVANYHASTLTQNQKDIQDISIPTVGAMMSAISAATPTLPTGTANTVVMYNNSGAIGGSRAIYDGSATYNATNDATKLVAANGVSKMKECTRWIDNAAHTDENCLLWRLP